MTITSNKKVCIVVSSLGGGGAERSSALLSEMLSNLGYEIHIVSVLDRIDYPYKGELLNLGKLKAEDDSLFGRIKRLRVFKRYLKTHKFDYVIDNRTRIGLKELVISKLIYSSQNTIYSVHSYKTSMYINPKKYLGKYLYKSAHKIVCVSQGISHKLKDIYNFKNLEVIYNPTQLQDGELSANNSITETYILFYGRLDDEVKNISLLIDAYSKSKLSTANVKLKILGDGVDKEKLILKVDQMGMRTNIQFLEFQKHPYAIVRDAMFTVLTSRFEGFPMVLIESLTLGTPVVSVDCKSGPDEIIINEENGLIVENFNVEALANAMNRMLEDKNLYLQCKSNAKKSVEKFSKDNIAQQWQALLK